MQFQVFRQRDLNLAERLVSSLTHAGVAILLNHLGAERKRLNFSEWRFCDFFPALILPAGLTQTTSSPESAVQNLCPATGA
jgi:hypothetical protein